MLEGDATAAALRAEARIAGPWVLVVDDEASTQKMLRVVLNGNGLRTVEAICGAEALAFAAAYNPDLVLLDLELPDFDGIDVTRRLRRRQCPPAN